MDKGKHIKLYARKMKTWELEEVDRFAIIAGKNTNKLLGEPITREERDKWTGVYAQKMNKLAIEAGLRIDLKALMNEESMA